MKTVVQHHLYLPGESDRSHRPQQLCATCQLPRQNARHQLKPQDQAVTNLEQRRIGEHE